VFVYCADNRLAQAVAYGDLGSGSPSTHRPGVSAAA